MARVVASRTHAPTSRTKSADASRERPLRCRRVASRRPRLTCDSYADLPDPLARAANCQVVASRDRPLRDDRGSPGSATPRSPRRCDGAELLIERVGKTSARIRVRGDPFGTRLGWRVPSRSWSSRNSRRRLQPPGGRGRAGTEGVAGVGKPRRCGVFL